MFPGMLLTMGAVCLVGSLAVSLTGRGESTTSTCGDHPDTVADCGRPDVGSCGTACCTLEVGTALTTEEVYSSLKAFLQQGGASGAYSYVSGPDGAGNDPADDLRPYNATYEFIFQGAHTTSGKHYVDTLNFNVRPGDGASSVVRMFSISNIHGALGDSGQNFKSLAYLMDAIGFDKAAATPAWGCGSTSPP
mmetsp:Transcript_1500/g.4390  ORF Transcript_1500/g.4390 Transcript_1500/m.4390 type:complete len:192 (+) Transcript_1500:50-625(+)